jgi:DNA primase
MGTSITERQVRSLKRYSKNLILALDSDAAGDLAMLRGIEVASEALETTSAPTLSPRGLVRYRAILDGEVRILRLPPDKDPDEIILADPDTWRQLEQDALPVVDFVMEAVLTTGDLGEPQAKTGAADRVLPLIGGLNDPVQQSHYLQRLARRLQVSEASLQQRLRDLRPSRSRPGRASDNVVSTKPGGEPGRGVEEHCLALLLRFPYLRQYCERIPPEVFRYTEHRVLLAAINLLPEEQDWNKSDSEALTPYGDPVLGSLLERLKLRSMPPMHEDEALKALQMTVRGLELERLRQQELALAALFDAAEEARNEEDEEAAERWRQLHEQGMAHASRLRAIWSDARNGLGLIFRDPNEVSHVTR